MLANICSISLDHYTIWYFHFKYFKKSGMMNYLFPSATISINKARHFKLQLFDSVFSITINLP